MRLIPVDTYLLSGKINKRCEKIRCAIKAFKSTNDILFMILVIGNHYAILFSYLIVRLAPDSSDYCPFSISRKDVFCLAFYLKWKYFVLIDYTRILSETICLFCFCVLFSNMYPKIKFIAKKWSDLCNFYSKVIFWNFCLSKYFYFALLNLNYWCFTTILWKFQKNWTSRTCWKSASKLPTQQISA